MWVYTIAVTENEMTTISEKRRAKRHEIEVNKALTDLRKKIRECGASETYLELMIRAEELQHMAFDLKSMARHGGTWADNHEPNKG